MTGFLSLGILVFKFIIIRTRFDQLRDETARELSGNPFAVLGDLAIQSIQLQWGWAVLIMGAGFLIASAALRDESKVEGDAQIIVPRQSKPNVKAILVTVFGIVLLIGAAVFYVGIDSESSFTDADYAQQAMAKERVKAVPSFEKTFQDRSLNVRVFASGPYSTTMNFIF